MSASCAHTREVAAELALGIADGGTRAKALDHLVGCNECRAELEWLAGAADELTLLAPPIEPPPGFEERASAAMRPARAARPTWRRLLRPVAFVATAAAAAAIVWFALGDDRRLADSYRETLAVANGEYFDAVPLELDGGAKGGYAYGYQGRASWVLAVVYDGVAPGRYRLVVVDRDGEREVLRELRIDADGNGSAGAVTQAHYDELTELLVLDARGRQVAEAHIGD